MRPDRSRRMKANVNPAVPETMTPLLAACMVLAAACVAASVTFRSFDTDLWQHLLVGKVIWLQHHVPTAQVWSWPTLGAPDTTSSYSWLFRALLWPVWSAGGPVGLMAWRWLTTLLAFALVWWTGRTLGARGYAPLVALVLCALVYRQRSQVRPETLASVLLALELLLLERRRRGDAIPAWWFVVLLWLWVNVHVSWVVGALVLAVFAVNELRQRAPRRMSLWQAGLAFLLVSWINPYGWRAVWQPFHFLTMMQEPLLRSIGELRGIDWHSNLRNGLPLLLVGWPVIALSRLRSRRVDAVEIVLAITFGALALRSGRFAGFLAIAACPYLGRDVSEWFASLRARPEWPRATAAALAMVALLPMEFLRPDLRPGVDIVPSSIPKAACDFVEAQGIRGRAFNHFELGGYMLWRFWPDSSRRPFMDIHQSGTPAERLIYIQAQARPEAWKSLAESYRLEWCLLARQHAIGSHLLDFVDADPAWALVFVDDISAIYVRRDGPLHLVARRLGYRWLSGGNERLGQAWSSSASDTSIRRAFRNELERSAAGSEISSTAQNLLASVALVDGRLEDSRRALQAARRIDPEVPAFHQRMGLIELNSGRPERALREFLAEGKVVNTATVQFDLGLAYSALGNLAAAKQAFMGSLAMDPQNTAARDSIAAIEARTGPLP
jgi:hypothetical protein